MPRISIVMPAYNAGRYIHGAITSVKAQTVGDWELVVVDDGSTDNTYRIARGFAHSDHRIRVIRRSNSGHPGIARNTGIAASSGEFLCFLDADDSYESRRLELALYVFDQYPGIGMVFHDMYVAQHADSPDPQTYLQQADFAEKAVPYVEQRHGDVWELSDRFFVFMALEYAAAHTNTVMIRRRLECAGGVRFNHAFLIVEDTDLWLRVAESSQVVFLDKPLATYRLHDSNITSDRRRFIEATLHAHDHIMKRLNPKLTEKEMLQYRIKMTRYHKELAYECLKAGNNAKALRCYCRCIGRPGAGPECWQGVLKSMLPWGKVRSLLRRKQG